MQIQLCAASTTPIVGATLVVALVGGCPNCSNVFCGYFITGWHKASPYINETIFDKHQRLIGDASLHCNHIFYALAAVLK
jgi:hypothetical protein